MKYGLRDEQIKSIREIFMKYPVERAILYGSRAMGTYKESSDIDIVLQGTKLSPRDVYNIEHELDELLLPYKFDLYLYSQVRNPDIIGHIERAGVVFYQGGLV
jgi:predicted nucleotidyltransferase